MNLKINSGFCMNIIIQVLFVICIQLPVVAADMTTERAEDRIKAAYLYKFCDYVEWPQETFSTDGDAIIIGILGADDLAADLETIVAGRQIRGRPVRVKNLKIGESMIGLHVLFIDERYDGQLKDIIMSAQNLPILTVTELEEDIDNEGVINFVVIGNRVRFDVALATAKRSKLKISSRLLTVARKVRDDTS